MSVGLLSFQLTQPQELASLKEPQALVAAALHLDPLAPRTSPRHHASPPCLPFSAAEEETPSESTEVDETPTPTEPSTEAPVPSEEPVLGELTVTGSSPDSLSLSWTVPQGHFDSFSIQYKDREGRPQVVRVGGEEREVAVEGLEPGRKYKMNLYGLHEGRRVGPVSTVGVTGE